MDIDSLLKEARLFPPDPGFSRKAHVAGRAAFQRLSRRAAKDPQAFWAAAARELRWRKPWKRVLEWKPPFAKWFVGGRLNASENCLDRHLEGPRRNKAAIVWEGEPGDTRTLTYLQLHREVCRFADALAALGVRRGDRVAVYMPLVPEAVVAMLACARLGAAHSVVFGGFSAEALRDRILDARAKLVITADGGWRKGEVVRLKDSVDAAVAACPCVEKVVVLKRTGQAVGWTEGRDLWWEDALKGARADRAPEAFDSENPLFILYTSGTTGKPKGVVHSTGGYLAQAALTARLVFDLKDEDVFWCTADIGWVTGHSYVVYGPLAAGATVFLYEGAPLFPQPDRFWSMIERHRVTVFYTAPTAIRTFLRLGARWPEGRDLSSLRLLGTVGEPINPEAWLWYRRVIGKDRCPVVDTWWQTETGAIMITPLPGAVDLKPGSATVPFPGISAKVVDRSGRPVPPDAGGFLVVDKPWPAMLRTIYGDPGRYKAQYFSQIPGVYFTGDGARRDKDGYFWILGRVDDVINVAGHRLSTMEIESALVSHPKVAEAAVVGHADDIKGQGITAFVTLQSMVRADEPLKEELRQAVTRGIGSIAKPDVIRFTDALPKTRSGKIMRRLLREIANGASVKGDTTTLEDLSTLARLQSGEEE